MRDKYQWYLPYPNTDLEDLWSNATLTIDANVLLDLYRYHEQTRKSLLDALDAFKGRLWISHQAAEEFIRNRKKVIASSEKSFRDAEAALSEVNKALEQTIGKLNGIRLVPRQIAEELRTEAIAASDKARQSILQVQADFPNYLREDPILDKILDLFDGVVGEAPDDAIMGDLLKEAAERQKNHIPPGYMDDDKEGDKQYGDFLLWQQILTFSSSAKVPVILVTSEQKEDWWEKHSGKRVGPRTELLKEAHSKTGQRFLLYQTDNFLEQFLKKTGSGENNEAIQEIRDIAFERGRKSTDNAVHVTQEILEAAEDHCNGIISINLNRPLYQLTGSGHFNPRLTSAPIISLEIVSTPPGTPETWIGARTGTTFDFNVHIKSREYGNKLPVGDYVFRYTADCVEEPDQEKPDIFS